MIIIQLAGGLGNQMFQYALYLQLKSLGKEVKIDDRTGFEQDAQREPALMPFGIDYERPTAKEMEQMLDSAPDLRSKVHRKLFGRNKKAYFEADKRYKPEIMSWDDIYLEGYWQTEKYFDSVSGEVKKAFDVDKLLRYIRRDHAEYADNVEYVDHAEYADHAECADDAEYVDNAAETDCRHVPTKEAKASDARGIKFEKQLAQITSEESVSVHIRRGDYLLPENQALFGDICTEAYYRKAMRQMKQEHPGCRFYLFTNDKQWLREQITGMTAVGGNIESVRKNPAAGSRDIEDTIKAEDVINIEDIEVVDVEGQNDYSEFVLMSKCRHNILANSSFSWWASYLNSNSDKTVFAPDRWLNGWDCTDFYRDDMRRIKTDSGQ